jgi:hypothetical protein
MYDMSRKEFCEPSEEDEALTGGRQFVMSHAALAGNVVMKAGLMWFR